MKEKCKLALAIVACVVGMAMLGMLAGCGKPVPSQTTIVNINQNTNTITVGESGAKDPAAVDGDVTKDTVRVEINAFGEVCPASILPANQNKKVRVGCKLDITVNPKNAAGQTIHDKNAPPPDYFLSLGPDSVATFVKDSNPYNAQLQGVSPGTVRLVAGVNGKRADETTFEVIP